MGYKCPYPIFCVYILYIWIQTNKTRKVDVTMMTDDDVIEHLMHLYKLTEPIAYQKKHKKSRDKLLKLIKKIRKNGLESVIDEG